jgi:alpha-D-xyloside xylohydrolase
MSVHRRIGFGPLLSACLLASCGNPPEDPGVQVDIGDDMYTLHVSRAGVSLGRTGEGTPLLVLPPSGFLLGTVTAVDDNVNYDPYAYEVTPAFTADGLAYSAPATFEPQPSPDGKHVDILLSYKNGARAQVTIERTDSGRFAANWKLITTNDQVAFFRLGAQVDSNEGLYGLGAYFDDVNQRGKLRAMQIEADGSLEGGYNEAHAPIPLLVGTRAWGLFVASHRPGSFAVATTKPDWVESTWGTGMASVTEGLAFHLFAAKHPLDITRHYYEVTGYPKLPARWALGPLVWRDENDDQAQVESDIAKIRTLDLATTGYWIDRPYATEVNTFDFNPVQFPDAPAMIAKMHNLGFRTALWHSPYLSSKSPATQALVAEATQKGYYPLQTGLLLNKWGLPIDLTVPEAMQWWQLHLKTYADMGIEGYKLDYGEDVVVGISASRISIWQFHDGTDERTRHDTYADLYHQAYAEMLPPEGGLLLIRHGVYGDQTHGGIFWPGDEDTGFAKHRETVTTPDGNTYVAVGGLPASVAYGLNLAVSGYPFFGSDTGGYRHTPPTVECFIRWFEQTSLASVMQIGTSVNTVAWEFFNATTDPDGSKLELYRKYTRLHLRMFPYEWTYAKRIAVDGRTITRPLGFAYPELGVHPSDIYLFGDDVLVAPVVTQGATTRSVTFPPGTWIDWWDGSTHIGGKTEDIAAPLEKLPLYVREGAIIPMLRDTIDTLSPTTVPAEVDSYATSPGVLWARVVAGPKTTFSVFDGAEIVQEKSGKTITLQSKDGAEFKDGALFEVVATGAKPASVDESGAKLAELPTLDALKAAPSGWTHVTDTGGTIYIKVPAGTHQVTILMP